MLKTTVQIEQLCSAETAKQCINNHFKFEVACERMS